MNKSKTVFEAIIKRHEDLNAAYVEFPQNVTEIFGNKGRVKVKAVFDKKVEYRGSLVKMGYDCHIIGITKEIRSKLGKSFGDSVNIEIEEDKEVRTVIVPPDAAALLNENPEVKQFFEGLSYTNRKEYIGWIESAKKEETRNARLVVFIEKMLKKMKFDDKYTV